MRALVILCLLAGSAFAQSTKAPPKKIYSTYKTFYTNLSEDDWLVTPPTIWGDEKKKTPDFLTLGEVKNNRLKGNYVLNIYYFPKAKHETDVLDLLYDTIQHRTSRLGGKQEVSYKVKTDGEALEVDPKTDIAQAWMTDVTVTMTGKSGRPSSKRYLLFATRHQGRYLGLRFGFSDPTLLDRMKPADTKQFYIWRSLVHFTKKK